jgi:hypothetical protein
MSVAPSQGGARIRRLAASRRAAGWVGFGWGLAEGVALFIVPDVYISLAALFSPGAGAVAWLASIAGSLVAVVTIVAITSLTGLDYVGFLDEIPGISAGMIRRVSDAVAAGGLPYTPLLVLGGVPLKLYAAAALSAGVSTAGILGWTVFARVVRIAPAFVAAVAVGRALRRRIEAHPVGTVLALAGWWAAFYALYFARIGWR